MAAEINNLHIRHTGQLVADNIRAYIINSDIKSRNINLGTIMFYCEYTERSQLPINEAAASRLLVTRIYPVMQPFKNKAVFNDVEITEGIDIASDIEFKTTQAEFSTNKRFYALSDDANSPILLRNRENETGFNFSNLRYFAGMDNFGIVVHSRWDSSTSSEQYDADVDLDFALNVKYVII